jgi:ABC-type sugar transport system substrate-binding protein
MAPCAALALLASACSGAPAAPPAATSAPSAAKPEATSAPAAAPTAGAPAKIAFLAVTQAAGYMQGISEAAKTAATANNVDLTFFDAQFDPQKQLSQCQDAIAAGTYKAIIVVPAASPALVPCAEDAGKAGIPLISTDAPIGSDLNSSQPQVPGVTAQVMLPAGTGISRWGPVIADACRDHNPCNVMNLIITPAIVLTTLTKNMLDDVVAKNPNVKIVGTCAGNAQRQGGLQCMQDYLQREPDIHVVVSITDDMALGAENALEAAGKTVDRDKGVRMVTAGGSYPGVERLRAGKWYATIVNNAQGEGRIPVELAAKKIRGEQIPTWVNPVEADGLPDVINKETLEKYPDFKGTFPA